MKLWNIRFEKIKIREGARQSWESRNEILLLKTLVERDFVNNLLKYLCATKILSYEFGCLIKFF